MGRSPIMKSVRFPDGVAFAEDWDYIVELLRQGWSIASCGEAPLAVYRLHRGSATGANREAHLAGSLGILKSLPKRPAQPRAGLERSAAALRIAPQKRANATAKRLQAHFVKLVLLGEKERAVELMETPEFLAAPPNAKWLNEDFFDVTAIRVFRQPRQSRDLHDAVSQQWELAFACCRLLPRTLANAALSYHFRCYMIGIVRAVRAEGRAGFSLFGERARLCLDAIPLMLAQAVFACRRIVKGLFG